MSTMIPIPVGNLIPNWIEDLIQNGQLSEGNFLWNQVARNAITMAVQHKTLEVKLISERIGFQKFQCKTPFVISSFLFNNLGEIFTGTIWKFPREEMISIQKKSLEFWFREGGI